MEVAQTAELIAQTRNDEVFVIAGLMLDLTSKIYPFSNGAESLAAGFLAFADFIEGFAVDAQHSCRTRF